MITAKFKDEDPRVRITALRLSEHFLKSDDTSLFSDLEKMIDDTDKEVINQLALSLRYSKDKQATALLNTIAEQFSQNEIIAHAVKESLKKDDTQLAQLKKRIANRGLNDKKSVLNGYESYNQLCATCHGPDLKGLPTEDGGLIAPSLIGSPRVIGDKKVLSKILLNGLIGPIEGKEYGIMVPLKNNSNDYIADVLSYVRAMNNEGGVHKNVVRDARKESQDREDYWTLEELLK